MDAFLTPQRLATAQWAVASALLGLMALCVPMAAASAGRQIRGWGRRSAWLVLAATAVAAVLRWVVAPKAIATVFIGYRATAEAIRLFPVPHYGIGTATFYNLVFSALPADHRTLMWTNAVLGVLTLPLLAALAGRLLREPRAGVVFAWMVALIPLFVRNDASDANNVPLLLWLTSGLLLWTDGLSGSRAALAAALPPLTLAVISRPEAPLLLVALVPIVTAIHGVRRPPWRDPLLIGLAVLAALAVVPHALHVERSIHMLRGRGSLPGPLLMWPTTNPTQHAVLHPLLYPVALLALAAAAVVRPGALGRGRAIALLAVAELAHALTLADCDWANVARVGVPEALLITMLAALGAVRLVELTRGRWALAAAVGIAALVAGAAVPTAHQLFRPTNERTEEQLIEEALDHVAGQGELLLLRPGAREEGEQFTHMFFPDYRLGSGQVSQPIAAFLARPDWRSPVWAFLGLRCYARFRAWGTPAPPGEQQREACARLRAEHTLEPVFERRVPNHGDVWIPYYGTAPDLLVGLYRVLPPSVPGAGGGPSPAEAPQRPGAPGDRP